MQSEFDGNDDEFKALDSKRQKYNYSCDSVLKFDLIHEDGKFMTREWGHKGRRS